MLQKRKKGSTFHVGRSPVLARVSELLQSVHKSDEVKNIEVVEEGEPVIDMSVTLIDTEVGNEYDSDNDTENGDLENGTEGKKLILCSDSESEMSENESNENEDENKFLFSDFDSELSENESEEDVFKNVCMSSYLKRKQYKNEAEKTVIEDNVLIYSDSVDDTPESEASVLKDTKLFTSSNSANEHSEKRSKKVVLKHATFQESDDEPSDQESDVNVDQEQYLQHSKLGLMTSNSSDLRCKYQSDLPKLNFTGEKKRKLISVIEEVDEQNLRPSTKQKTV